MTKINRFKIKKDRKRSARGGNSHFLQLFCSQCSSFILTYQKDGKGDLIRCYLDRIFEPESFQLLSQTAKTTSDLSKIECPKCKQIIAVPMLYEPEKRLAYRLIRGSFAKKGMG